MVCNYFYISDYFEHHRTEYYDALNRVRLNNDLASWIKFFLNAVIETARSGKDKFKAVTEYVREVESTALSLGGRPDTVLRILRVFYDRPVLNSKEIVTSTGLSQGTVDNTLKRLFDNGILREITGYSRNRVFILYNYLVIFDN